jgi:hypothetical protein
MLLQNLVTFINNKELKLIDLDMLLLNKSKGSSWSTHYNLWRSVLELQNLSLFIDTAINLGYLKTW